MRLSESKKAQAGESEAVVMVSFEALTLIMAFAIPAIGIIIALLLTGIEAQDNSYASGVESFVIKARFMDSPDCFTYRDPATGRIYTGVIEQSKFTQERLNQCYDVPEDFVSGCFRLELKDLDTGLEVNHLESLNYETCLLSKRMISKDHLVLIKTDEGMHAGALTIISNNK